MFNYGVNLALNKPAKQQSTYASGVASLAVDGLEDTRSCTNYHVHPWLSVDLEAMYDVGQVAVVHAEASANGKISPNFFQH